MLITLYNHRDTETCKIHNTTNKRALREQLKVNKLAMATSIKQILYLKKKRFVNIFLLNFLLKTVFVFNHKIIYNDFSCFNNHHKFELKHYGFPKCLYLICVAHCITLLSTIYLFPWQKKMLSNYTNNKKISNVYK